MFWVLRRRVRQNRQVETRPLLLAAVIQLALMPLGNVAVAQLMPDTAPDRNLGTTVERSPDLDRIMGGTLRGVNLFHSFQEFNVNQGQRVYFANPTGVENILSRVTGQNASNILGTLGVEGRANLFLLNPNGILFGPNVRLDIRGSFVASTASRFKFADDTEFSATNPQSPPLLTVNLTPGLQYGSISPGSTIVNRGNLAAGQDLTLVSDRLDLQGRLQSGGDLTLHAQDIVQVRDSATTPFLAQAGNNLLLQGDRAVDIFALNHSNSGLVAGKNLTLRSANPVLGDAHFWSGGHFRTEQLDGSLGMLESPHDPVIRTVGDVFINAYQGASLHILAGGSVTIPNGIVITGADPANGLVETVTLSDGSSLQINGQIVPTVDIRAGVNPTVIGGPPLIGTGLFTLPTSTTATPSSANIRVGDIVNRGGTVFLTNLYQPNGSLRGEVVSGAIDTRRVIGNSGDSGAVVLNSRSNIRFTSNSFAVDTSSGAGQSGAIWLVANDSLILDGATNRIFGVSQAVNGKGGEIRLSARNAVIRNGALLGTGTFGRGNAGDITIDAIDTVAFDGVGIDEYSSSAISQVSRTGTGNSGTIAIRARTVSLTNGAYISTDTRGRGNAGNVTIDATDAVLLDGTAIDGFSSAAGSQVVPGAIGNSGDLIINTGVLSVTRGAVLNVSTFGRGNAGNIIIQANRAVTFDGVGNNGLPSLSGSQVGPGAVGSGGNVSISAGTLSVANGALLSTNIFGTGKAGSVIIRVSDAVSFDGTGRNGLPSAAVSQVVPGAVGDGGNVDIRAGKVSVTNGALLSTSTAGKGNAGNVFIQATDTVSLDGVGRTQQSSSVVSQVASEVMGTGGNVTIAARSLSVTNGAALDTSTFGTGKAGNVIIQVIEFVAFDGVGSNGSPSGVGSKVGDGAAGDGGNLTINSRTLSVTNGAQLSVGTLGTGNAGNIIIQAVDAVSFNGVGRTGQSSGAGSQVGAGATGDGGNLTINSRTLSVTNGAQLDVSTLGTGNAGNISIQAIESVAFDGLGSNGQASGAGSQVAPGATGNGGNITIGTQSLSLSNQAILTTSNFGRGNAGDVDVRARSVQLEDGSAIGAITASGSGGNIILNLGELLLLRRGSLISTTAGTAQAGGDGGNITINVPEGFVVAVLEENSDITANAYTGRGGNIQITAQGIFGLRFRPQLTPLSDITASSQFGVSGVVTLNTLNIDPNRGLVALPTELVDPSELLDQQCAAQRNPETASSFYVIGRGGLPYRPGDLPSALFSIGTVRPAVEVPASTASASPPFDSPKLSLPIIEATHWTRDSSGHVALVASATATVELQTPECSSLFK